MILPFSSFKMRQFNNTVPLLFMVGGQGPNDLQRAALERKKQRAEAQGLAEIVTSREALKLQLENGIKS